MNPTARFRRCSVPIPSPCMFQSLEAAAAYICCSLVDSLTKTNCFPRTSTSSQKSPRVQYPGYHFPLRSHSHEEQTAAWKPNQRRHIPGLWASWSTPIPRLLRIWFRFHTGTVALSPASPATTKISCSNTAFVDGSNIIITLCKAFSFHLICDHRDGISVHMHGSLRLPTSIRW